MAAAVNQFKIPADNRTGPREQSFYFYSGILIHPAVWPQQTWAEIWKAVPLLGRGAGSLSNTMWPGPRPTSTTSLILINPTVWPQYTNVTSRTDTQDNGPMIGQTVLQTVAPKRL